MGKAKQKPFKRKFSSYQTAKGKKATAKYPELENMSLKEGTEYLRAMRKSQQPKKARKRRVSKKETGLDTFKYTPGPSGR